MEHIRNSAKAIIIKDGRLLCTKNKGEDGIYYLLPGGGQEYGETLHEALRRECREEICAEIEIGDILFVRDYIGKNHKFVQRDYHMHQVEYMFQCTILNENEIKNGIVPDTFQVGSEWLEISRLHEYNLYPSKLKDFIGELGKKTNIIYMGDVI